ncbi:hypothetical protein [Halobacterium litoreum]|uniref:Uncharacterized protein n=1 Tax=Halobacterium litoreum TaxID=2039234 RepID=A0ABD5NHV5_9EURY|nr:hypothetical protein [Halobacterium litoreum]UHH12291.1 hypothetical protein LT972_08985 [Halobacterium litoreum]
MNSPTRRAAVAVGVALLLVTAGCSGGANPASTATTTGPTTDAAAPTDTTEATATTSSATTTQPGTWSPNASVGQYPPGVADNGTLVNASTLLGAHFAATTNTSMALRLESSGDDGVSAHTLTHGPERVPFYSTAEETHDGERVWTEFYGTQSHGFARVPVDNETHHLVYQNTTANVDAWTGYETFGGVEDHVHPLLHGGSYSVNGTVERGDRTLVELTTDADSLETGHITNGTVLVTPAGVIYDVDATVVQQTGEDTERRLDASMTLDTDVEWSGPPSWMADVPRLSLSIVEDGQAIEIRNTGGAAVPANTSFAITGGESRALSATPGRGDVKGTVTTDAPLEPGEAVYVTAGADGAASSFALHDDPTRGEYTFGNAGLTGGLGSIYYRLATGISPKGV